MLGVKTSSCRCGSVTPQKVHNASKIKWKFTAVKSGNEEHEEKTKDIAA